MRHSHHVTFDSHGKECNVPVSFGAMPVRLPTYPEKELHLVVVKGFGQDPMMLLTSLPVDGAFKSQWRIVEAYLTRWRVEETIRFVKQSYGFENIRVMTYTRIRNMASLVLASAYFATVWIAVSDAKRRKPHPETHFSLYPCGCGALPRSKNG